MQLHVCSLQICGENQACVLLVPRTAKSYWLKRFAEAFLRLNRQFYRGLLSSSFEVPF